MRTVSRPRSSWETINVCPDASDRPENSMNEPPAVSFIEEIALLPVFFTAASTPAGAAKPGTNRLPLPEIVTRRGSSSSQNGTAYATKPMALVPVHLSTEPTAGRLSHSTRSRLSGLSPTVSMPPGMAQRCTSSMIAARRRTSGV